MTKIQIEVDISQLPKSVIEAAVKEYFMKGKTIPINEKSSKPIAVKQQVRVLRSDSKLEQKMKQLAVRFGSDAKAAKAVGIYPTAFYFVRRNQASAELKNKIMKFKIPPAK